jgi:hypothetical protein
MIHPAVVSRRLLVLVLCACGGSNPGSAGSNPGSAGSNPGSAGGEAAHGVASDLLASPEGVRPR